MRFHVFTIFPNMFEGPFAEGDYRAGPGRGVGGTFVYTTSATSPTTVTARWTTPPLAEARGW